MPKEAKPSCIVNFLFLGSDNYVSQMGQSACGRWWAKDITGAVYHQYDFPKGLHVAFKPQDEKILTPWPPTEGKA